METLDNVIMDAPEQPDHQHPLAPQEPDEIIVEPQEDDTPEMEPSADPVGV